MKKGWLIAIGAIAGVAAVAGTVAAVVAKKKGYNIKDLCKTVKDDECECGCCDCCCEVDDLPEVPEMDEDITVEGTEEVSEDVATTEDVVDTTVENEKKETETVSE